MKTTVSHVYDGPIKGDRVYVGRGMRGRGYKESRFANPFKIGRMTRAEAIKAFDAYLHVMLDRDPVAVDALLALRGKVLCCWCRHDGQERTSETECHADVLADILNRFTDEEIRAKTHVAVIPLAV